LEKIDDMSPEDAATKLEQVLSEFVHILLEQPQGKEMAQFMLKGVAQASEVLDLVFPKFTAPVHESLCLLWAKATGQNASSSDVILTVFSLVGQVIYFRVGQEIVRRRMGWDSVEQTEVHAIQNVIRTNLRAALDVARKGSIR